MRVAIVHYWLLKMRGGEKVVEALCRLLPTADIFTLFYDPDRVSKVIRERKVTASFLNSFKRYHRSFLPLMPLALESFDLRDYDLVISSESGPAKGVLASSKARHVCYCHTPMRYLWELYPAYLYDYTRSPFTRMLMAPLANYLRLWDYASAARVDTFVANSRNVKERIWRAYRRESDVIHPPVATETFYWKEPQDYFLLVSELVSYKRIDTAVRVFSRTGRRLRIVGTGPEYASLRRLAGPAVEFCGWVTEDQLRDLYSRSRALVFPGEEDFGIVPVEAMASGKPVIALGRGGVLESLPDSGGGVLYSEPEDDLLAEALARFEKVESQFQASVLQEHASRFSEARFRMHISPLLGLGEFQASTGLAGGPSESARRPLST
jgi:glycosyltransferase involved in cell wall biosynthesis